MTTYKYNFFAKILYRYGNIPVTLFLFIFLIDSVIQLQQQWYSVFFIIINLSIIISLNKYYLKTYKIFPFKIEADNEKMICSDFFFNIKIIEIKYSSINKINGGIFSGYPARAIYFHDAENNFTIGFYSQSTNFKNLLRLILKNIPQSLYNNLLDELKKGTIR